MALTPSASVTHARNGYSTRPRRMNASRSRWRTGAWTWQARAD